MAEAEDEALHWSNETGRAAAPADKQQFHNVQDAVDSNLRSAAAEAANNKRHATPSSAAAAAGSAPAAAASSDNNSGRTSPRGGGTPRQAMPVPVATLGNDAANPHHQHAAATASKRQQIAAELHDASRRVTTQERQRDRVYRKELMQQERGNADVDYSSWESGNAPDAMTLRLARSVTAMVRDVYGCAAQLRREIRQRNVDALANGSPLSEAAGGAVRDAMGGVYPLSTALVATLEEGLRAVMPLFSASMRNTEGLSTLVQIRDHIGAEAARDVNAAQPTSAALLAARAKLLQQQQQAGSDFVPVPPPVAAQRGGGGGLVPQPPASSSSSTAAASGAHQRTQVSRLDSHSVYDREAESADHTNKPAAHRASPLTAPGSSARGLTSSPPRVVAAAAAANRRGHNAGESTGVLTTLKQVEAEIQERGEIWPPDQRRHQAHSTLHQRVHPSMGDAARRVEAQKAALFEKHGVASVVPPLLNKLVLASLPQSARSGHGAGDAATTTDSHSARTANTSVAEMKRLHRQQMQQQQKPDASEGAAAMAASALAPTTPRMASPLRAAQSAAEDMMARYPQTADGFSSRIMCLREPKLGVWRHLSVTEKQHVVAFEQRENRYHHAHGITNMKLAGLRAKFRRGERTGVEPSAGDCALYAECAERKRILQETRHADVRQTALLLRQWIYPIPERFSDHPAPARLF